jgi:hypothetical protein
MPGSRPGPTAAFSTACRAPVVRSAKEPVGASGKRPSAYVSSTGDDDSFGEDGGLAGACVISSGDDDGV